MLQDGQCVAAPRIPLEHGGRRKWDDRIVKHAQSIEIGARRGNLDVLSPRTGVATYWKIMQYQMRELFDLRKITYDQEQHVVYWRSYKGGRTKYDAGDFICHLYEYRNRLGQWGAKPGQNLHRRYGHLSKRNLRSTQKIMGGDPITHLKDCPCTMCSDWDRVFIDEVEDAMRRRVPH